MKYDVDYFIEKFEKIPEEKWAVGLQNDGNGNHCAFGWCRTKESLNRSNVITWSGSRTDEGKALIKLFNTISPDKRFGDVAIINNGDDDRYQQPTPKQRILAALQDIKKLHGEAIAEGNQDTKGLYPDITKELAVVEDRIETDKINVYAS